MNYTDRTALMAGDQDFTASDDMRPFFSQYYCRNHPAPDEPRYPLWRGLPLESTLTRAQLAERVRACTGVGSPQGERTDAQRRNLVDILNVVRIPEDELVSHLAWATFTFRDLVGRRLDGLNPFDNSRTRYSGSHDDRALNAGVERFSADPIAVARLAYDSDLTGLIVAPTITVHAKSDPIAFVLHERAYRDAVARAGRSDLLVQTFTNEAAHSRLSPPEYVAALAAMAAWIDRAERPTPRSIADQCRAAAPRYGAECFFDPDAAPH